jgi:hypothetical protein
MHQVGENTRFKRIATILGTAAAIEVIGVVVAAHSHHH